MLTVKLTRTELLDRFLKNEERIKADVLDGPVSAVAYIRSLAPKGQDRRKGGVIVHYGGSLRRGIIRMPVLEKSRTPGKFVAEIVMARDMNPTFQKPAKNGKHYYYPSSQEHGFKHAAKGGGYYRVPGRHFFYQTGIHYENIWLKECEDIVRRALHD